MGQNKRQIVAGAVSVPYGFEITDFDKIIHVTLRVPNGNELKLPLDIALFAGLDEYSESIKSFTESIVELEKQ